MTPKPLLKTPTPLFWSACGRAPKEWSAVICCMQTPEFLRNRGARSTKRRDATRKCSWSAIRPIQTPILQCVPRRSCRARTSPRCCAWTTTGRAQLAAKLGEPVAALERLIVWGNHSSTMYLDIRFATVCGAPVQRRIQEDWLRDVFIPSVAQRGAAIINARGHSSAASAAQAALEHMRDWMLGSQGRWVTM